jgi:hypothetical protein
MNTNLQKLVKVSYELTAVLIPSASSGNIASHDNTATFYFQNPTERLDVGRGEEYHPLQPQKPKPAGGPHSRSSLALRPDGPRK